MGGEESPLPSWVGEWAHALLHCGDMRLLPAILLTLAACGDGEGEDTAIDPSTCKASNNPTLELAQYGPYGELSDGADFVYGHPPQGGAPYAPFSLRISGIEQGDMGMAIEMLATDSSSGEELGTGEYMQRFICSNVGDNSGKFVGADLHMRFYGWELDDLEGRTSDVTISASNDAGDRLETSFQGILIRE